MGLAGGQRQTADGRQGCPTGQEGWEGSRGSGSERVWEEGREMDGLGVGVMQRTLVCGDDQSLQHPAPPTQRMGSIAGLPGAGGRGRELPS